MAATFTGTLLDPAGNALALRPVQVFPLGPSATSAAPVDAFTDDQGDFALTIPSDVRCLFHIPDLRIHHVLTPSDGEALTIEDILTGDASRTFEP